MKKVEEEKDFRCVSMERGMTILSENLQRYHHEVSKKLLNTALPFAAT